MKKQALTFLLAASLPLAAGAQDLYDALRYSDYTYYGTARSIAMGNAFTALGGDLGSIGINPAGSAVNSYSQLTLSPGVSIAGTKSQWCTSPYNNMEYGSVQKSSIIKFKLPNFGASMSFSTNRKRGLTQVTMGIIGNMTANYSSDMAAWGDNEQTSFLSALAVESEGIRASQLKDARYFSSNLPWDKIVAYRSGMIATYGDSDSQYVGATEKIYDSGDIAVAGPLKQMYGRRTEGGRYDLLVNFGFNFSDIVYVGANIGTTDINYKCDTYYKEIAYDPSMFDIDYGNGNIAYFSDMRYRTALSAIGTGIYGKFGVIVRPIDGLRIGAAIQTPTSTRITEKWQYAGETNFTDSNYNASETTEQGEYEYKLVSPFRTNIGVAYTFSKFGLISIDYETCNYSSMKFIEIGTNDNSGFEYANTDIKDFMSVSHMIRVGGEIRPVPEVSLRAGYNITTTPERYYDEYGKQVKPENASKTAISIGAGYDSGKSFFCDLAARRTALPQEYVYPYNDYIDGMVNHTPEILNRRNMWDVVLTLGFRF